MLDRDGNLQKEEVEITIPAFCAVSVFDVNVMLFIMLRTSLNCCIYSA